MSPSPEGAGRVLCQSGEVNAGVLLLPPASGACSHAVYFYPALDGSVHGFDAAR